MGIQLGSEGPSERIIEYEFDDPPVRSGPVLWGINSYKNLTTEVIRTYDRLERLLSTDIAELLLELADEEFDKYISDGVSDGREVMPEDWYRAAGLHGLHTMADALSRIADSSGAISTESIVMGLAVVKTQRGGTIIEELMSLNVVKDDEGRLMYRSGLDVDNEGYRHDPAPMFKSLMNQAIEALPEE